jgi:hypothetical protein
MRRLRIWHEIRYPTFVTVAHSSTLFQWVMILGRRLWSLHLGDTDAGVDQHFLGLARQVA